ncbi:MAG: peptidase domain-containing ABC transporter, partial [Betaproteobacteria bacterium]|nr:peptidase domain-containing ABC transporter [Betaproteobacteria bacterium]
MLFSSASYAWGLEGICQLHRIPFAPNVILQQIPPPYSLISFQQAADAIGLKSAVRQVPIAELSGLPLPCLAVLVPMPPAEARAGDAASDAGDQDNRTHSYRLAIVLRCDGQNALYIAEGEQRPLTASIADFARDYAGIVLLFAREADSAPVDETGRPAVARFGFRWFIPELLKHRNIWRDVLLASLAIQVMALATPIFTQVIIDKVIVHHTTNTLIVIAVALFMFMAFTAGMSWVRQYLVLHTGNRIDAVLGTQVFEHLFKLPLRYFEHRPTGTLVARVQGVETIRAFLSGAAVTLILDVPFLLIFLAVMFYYSLILTVITLGVLVLIAALSLAITPLLRERINQQFLLGARNQAFLTEYVAGMETVKSLQMEPRLNARFGDYLAAYLEAGFRTRQLANSYNVAANTLEQFLTLAILCIGAWLVMTTQSMTIGMLVAFQMFATRLSGPMLRMVGLWQEFQQASIAVHRLGDVMNAPVEPYSVNPARAGEARGRIELQDLSFRYAGNLPSLFRGLSLAVDPGQCVAIMGPSGSGKSTLSKLLQGFYFASDGAILLDGLDVRHFSANELRQHFGVVPQETTLFSGTIFDNLALANPHATFEQVVQACKYAEIHQTIEALPKGYQTKIGEHGAGLSGGQKQRIAIARALLKRPRILIFDEATSSLDEPTAEQFVKTVNRLKGRVTMIFIAHQLPTGLNVDSVV